MIPEPRTRRPRRRGLAALAGAALVVALGACDAITDPSPDPTTTATPAPVDVEPSSTPAADPTPTEDPTPTPPAEEDLPGTALDGFPAAGVGLVIVGVDAQEILNLRIGPGIDFASVQRMPPDTELVATGRNRDLGGSAGVWFQVRAGDDVGWVISSYVAEPGASRVVTDQLDPAPRASERSGLAAAVAAAWGPGEPTVVFGPVGTDDVQLRVDVLTGDLPVVGARLFVVAERTGSGYVVTRVTATQLCAAGVTGTGTCA